jgi:hypothetical protein
MVQGWSTNVDPTSKFKQLLQPQPNDNPIHGRIVIEGGIIKLAGVHRRSCIREGPYHLQEIPLRKFVRVRELGPGSRRAAFQASRFFNI